MFPATQAMNSGCDLNGGECVLIALLWSHMGHEGHMAGNGGQAVLEQGRQRVVLVWGMPLAG